jgi:cytochrome b561
MNGPDRFGWVTRVIHWGMAVAILGTLGLGAYVVRMEVGLGNLWLYGLHKSLGLSLLLLVVVRIVWHRISPPPAPMGGVAAWQMRLAYGAHGGLYALMVAVPVTGWAGSAATGLDVVWWGWTVPRVVPVSEGLAEGMMAAHGWLTTALMAVVALHVAGALWRAVGHGDGTVRRMLTGHAMQR